MRIATWQWGGRLQAGTMSAEGSELTPLAVADGATGALEIIERLARGDGLPREAGPRLPAQAVRLAAPIPQPRRNLFCAGRNYRSHAAELSTSVFAGSLPEKDAWPILFTKFPETVTGPHDTVRLPDPAISREIDYESELAIVIGKRGRNISRSRAMDHVFGYTIVNDVSARDVQVRHQQWVLGKSFDTFCPMGPCIVTADEVDGRDVRVRGWCTPRGGSAELRQDGSTRDLIFDIPTLIETCSRGITLLPGDIIATGTPAGVGMGFQPPKWLQPGDRFRIEIDGIGAIDNLFDHA
ncbi:MAG TPA: fumarylacetoacetate hydrolase family protein [Ramlibacter sp.]|nr:fumarylacetoacetate hydrolase family protein [Ramlibacter sp.]